MKKLKKLIAFGLTFLMTGSVCANAFACNSTSDSPGNENKPNEAPNEPQVLSFTFTVVDLNGETVPNTKLTLSKSGESSIEITTDENGKATTQATAGYTVTITSLPESYKAVTESITTIELITSYTLTVKKTTILTLTPPDEFVNGPLEDGSYWGDRYHHIRLQSDNSYYVTFEDATEKVFSFIAGKSGTYAIYTTGNVDTVLEHYDANEFYFPETLKPRATADDKSETDKNFYYELDIESKYAETPQTFIFSAKETAYPVTFVVSIERIGNSSVKDDIEETVRNSSLTKMTDITENQTRVSIDVSRELVFNDTDGFYHVDSADGPIAMVAITSENAYEDLQGSSLCTACQNSAFTKKIPQEDSSYNLVKYYNDYVLLDIAGMVYNPTLNGRGGYEIQDETAAKINSSGDYGLTKDLYDMIQAYVCKAENTQEAAKISVYKFLYWYKTA